MNLLDAVAALEHGLLYKNVAFVSQSRQLPDFGAREPE
jgi:hypothetical protein